MSYLTNKFSRSSVLFIVVNIFVKTTFADEICQLGHHHITSAGLMTYEQYRDAPNVAGQPPPPGYFTYSAYLNYFINDDDCRSGKFVCTVSVSQDHAVSFKAAYHTMTVNINTDIVMKPGETSPHGGGWNVMAGPVGLARIEDDDAVPGRLDLGSFTFECSKRKLAAAPQQPVSTEQHKDDDEKME